MRCLLLALLLAGTSAFAAEQSAPADPQSIDPQDLQARWASFQEDAAQQAEWLAYIESLPAETQDSTQYVVDRRIAETWTGLYETWLAFAEDVAAAEEAGVDTSAVRTIAVDGLRSAGSRIRDMLAKVFREFDTADWDASAADQAANLVLLEEAWVRIARVYRAALRHVALIERMQLDEPAARQNLAEYLRGEAESASVALEIATEHEHQSNARVRAVPGDTELLALDTVARNRVAVLSRDLSSLIGMMKTLELEVSHYESQVIAATGQITTDIFDFKVLSDLAADFAESARTGLAEEAPGFLFDLLLFALMVFAAVLLGRLIANLVQRAIVASHVDVSQLMQRTLLAFIRNGVLIVGVLVGLAQFGISLGPVLAGLGIAGFIVGFALQDSLSNFASGMLMLIYRPFDVGDTLETGGVLGRVSHMTLVNTTIHTFDNQTLIVPNNMIWQDVIKNVTAQKVRRVDLEFGVGYGDDLDLVERVLHEIVSSHDRVLPDPEPVIRMHTLGDSSVNFIVRPWVATDDYWDVYWDIMRSAKTRFDEAGINIPFPQRDVHIIQE